MQEAHVSISQTPRQRKSPTRQVRRLPPQSSLLEWLRYDPDTGILYRTAKRKGGPNANNERIPLIPHRPAGSRSFDGYLVIKLFGMSNLQVSRVIWAIQTGLDPGNLCIDHVNGDRSDNRWCNLRLATYSQNSQNKTRPSHPRGKNVKTSLKGVTAHQSRTMTSHTYWARIMVNGKRISLGFFPTEKAAHAAYCKAAKRYYGEFARFE